LSSIEFGNQTKSNIELCVRNRTQSNSIHWIVFDWVRPPNSIEHNPINWVRLGSIAQFFFVWVRFRSIAEINRTQSMDWVRLSSIEFDWNSVRLGSIDYAGSKWKIETKLTHVKNTRSFSVAVASGILLVHTLLVSSRVYRLCHLAFFKIDLDS